MLNLIKNEYAKIFHKKNTYFFLSFILICIVAIPVYTKFKSSGANDYTYYASIEEELSYAKSEDDEYRNDAYIEQLELASELGLTFESLYDDSRWESDALNTYYLYRSNIISYEKNESDPFNPVTTQEEKLKYQSLCDRIVSSLKSDDWKSYFRIILETLDTDQHSEEGKKLLTASYEKLIQEDSSFDLEYYQLLCHFKEKDLYYASFLKNKQDGISYDEADFNTARSEFLIAQYQLENNASSVIYKSPDFSPYTISNNYIYTGKLFVALKRSLNVSFAIALFLIILAGTIISSEFSNGTIKFLLITPVKRYKIFWSKFITIFSFGFGLTILSYLLSVLFATILFGPADLSTPLLSVQNDTLVSSSGLQFIFLYFILNFIKVMIATTIAFMLSSLFRNSAIAIAIALITYLSSGLAVDIAQALSLDFVRYTIFAHMDIIAISQKAFLFLGMTQRFAIGVIIIHIFLMLLIAHDAFTRKNI